MVLGFMQTSVHQYRQLVSFKTPWGIKPILKKVTVLSQVLCCICQLSGHIPLCPGDFKWPWVTVLQLLSQAHNVPLSAGCVTRWLCDYLGTKLTHREKLTDFMAGY